MLSRKELANSTLWPLSEKSRYEVHIAGEMVGWVRLTGPVRGSDLARMMHPDAAVLVVNGQAVPVDGRYTETSRQPFDTAVVTERKQVTIEERLNRIEKAAMRAARRQAEREDGEVIEKVKAKTEPEPQSEPEPAPEPKVEAEPEVPADAE